MKLRERVTFWRESRGRLETTGAVQPSSRFLARAMVRPVARAARRADGVPRRIVEMGPGTGSVTRALAATLRPADRLDCYEINEEFAAYLERRIAAEPVFADVRERIVVHRCPAQEALLPDPAQFVVCSLPLNNFDPGRVDEIFAAGRRLVADDGWFTYFEYPIVPRILGLGAGAAQRRRLRAVAAVKRDWGRYRRATELVVPNIPPARIVHLRFP